jgi:hypothetical protein
MKRLIFFCLLISAFSFGCKIFKPLLPPKVVLNTPISDFKYVVLPNTGSKTSNNTALYGGAFNMYGTTTTQSVNPKDIISGMLMKKGFIVLPEIKDEIREKTLIVNYGESGKRMTGLGGYTLEVTISFVSAKNLDIVGTCVAEGQGSTESDDIRIAIQRCLDAIFQK